MNSAALKLESTQTDAALRGINSRLFEILKPPPRLSVSEWADEYRELSREANAKGGKWRSLPFQIEPMDAVLDPKVQSVSLMWASQLTGKTEVENNIIGYFIHQDPAPILFMWPTLEMAEAWSKDRFSTMLRDTPVLRGLVKDARARDSGNTILSKSFPGGQLSACGANSPASMASRPIRITLFDEVDRYPPSAGTEGDPITLGEKRSESFFNAVSFRVSTPTIKGASRIEKEIEISDQCKWFCPCPKCGAFQVLAWHQVKWPEDNPEEAYLECDKCSYHLSDTEREKMVRAGEWRSTAPFKGKRGYILNGINVLFKAKKGFKNRLHQMAVSFLDAKARGKESIKTWTNTFLAETWEEEASIGPAPELLFNRRENYEAVPMAASVLVAFGDVQADRIEVEIMAAGAGEETWGIDYRVFKGNIESEALWNEVDAFCQQKWPHESGAELQPAAIGFDSGHSSKTVYAHVRRVQPRRVYATKGIGTGGIPWVTRSRKAPVLLLKINTAKEQIYSRANIIEPGAGYLHFNERYDLEYFRQLFSERVVTRYRFGNPYKTFEQHGRNEALDVRVGCLAMLEVLRPNYAKLEEYLRQSAPIKSGDTTKTSPKPERPRQSFVKAWRR